jgi:hypothetical protein
MENQTSSNNPSENLNNQPKKRRAKWIIIALIIILVALFLILGGYNNIKTTIKGLWAVNQYNAGIELYEKTMLEDTYGGKTPEETLVMFIDALEKGDIELASKYFILDDNLSRQKWEDGLKQAQEEGRILKIIESINQAEKSENQSGLDSEFQLVILGKDGLAENTIFMKLNEYSKVWKIESM